MALAVLTAAPAFAACDDPAWDTEAVMARLAEAVPSAEAWALDRGAPSGLSVALVPISDVRFDAPPERPARNPDPRGAVLRFDAGAAGTYRVALSERAWIDVVQDGKYLPPVAFVDFTDCPDLHKIVAFDIGAGPFTLQLSDATAPSLTMALTRSSLLVVWLYGSMVCAP
jgi:hypothetical protein